MRNSILFFIFTCILSISILGIIVPNRLIDKGFLLHDSIVLVFCFFCFLGLHKVLMNKNNRGFNKSIYFYTILIGFFYLLFYSIAFYWITNTHFDVEALDQIYYDQTAKAIADSNFKKLYILNDVDFDDRGYSLILSLLYYISDDSVYFARIVQIIVLAVAFSLIFKISSKYFSNISARYTALLLMSSQTFYLFASTHFKETFLGFFTIVFIYSALKILSSSYKLKYILLFVISIIFILSMRTVVGLISILVFLFFFFLEFKGRFIVRIFTISFTAILIIFLLNYFGVLDQLTLKFLGYSGIEDSESVNLGGRNIEQYNKGNRQIVLYIIGIIFSPLALLTPLPSFVLANIKFFDQTLQWWFAGGFLYWLFFTLFIFTGIYSSLKKRNIGKLFILTLLVLNTVALLASVYITSFRFNYLKMLLASFFIGYGIEHFKKRNIRFVYLYSLIIGLIIILWNLQKVKGL